MPRLGSISADVDVSITGEPSGPAGGVLGGTYPDPSFAADMATQAELDAGLATKANSSHTHGAGDLTFDVATQAELNTAVANAVNDGDTAGGVLGGTYPNPSFAADMATQAELNAVAAAAVNDGDAAGGGLAGTFPNPTLAAIANRTVLGNASGGSAAPTALIIGDGLDVFAGSYLFNPFNHGNVLINGGGDFWQRQTPGTDASRADATYAADRWYVLNQSNPINVKRIAGDKTLYAHRLTQSNASAQRIGYAQYVESVNCGHLQGRDISFQGKVRISNQQPLKVAIFGWSGTADAPTKDVVNDWTSTNYTDGNFFISTTFDMLAVGPIDDVVLGPAANTWVTFSLVAQAVAAYNNYGVLVWTVGTAAQNVTLDLAELQLLPNSAASGGGGQHKAWVPRPYSEELALCQRYYEKSFPIDTIPDDAATAELSPNIMGACHTVNDCTVRLEFKTPKRSRVYTLTTYKPYLGTTNGLGCFFAPGAGAMFDFTSHTQGDKQESGVNLIGSRTAGFVAGHGVLTRVHWTVDAEL